MRKALVLIDRVTRDATGWAARSIWRACLVVGLFTAIVLIPGVSALPVTDRDEARFAQASKQMLETGDLVDIRFQDTPRWKKPAGIYWMQAGAAWLLAEDPDHPRIWVYRLPSLLGGLIAAIGAVWALWPLLTGRAAVVAGLFTGAAALVAAEANIAKTDAMLLACSVIALGAFARMFPHPDLRRDQILFWSALGVGVLLKGPIILIPAISVVVWLCVSYRNLEPAKVIDWTGAFLFLAITVPWLLAIAYRSEGGFFAEALGRDLFGKVASGQESHGAPPGYYLATVWALFWPAAPLLILASPYLWARRRMAEVQILAGWAIPCWLIFELTPTKLPHYILPVLPAVAGLIAIWLTEDRRAEAEAGAGPGPGPGAGAEDPPRKWPGRIAAGLFALVGAGLALAVMAGPVAVQGVASPGAMLLGAVGLGAVALGARAILLGWRDAFLGAGLAAALTLYPAALHFALPRMDIAFPTNRMMAAMAPVRACMTGPVATISYREPSLVFLAGTDTALLETDAAARLLAGEDGRPVWVEDRARTRFDAALAGTGAEVRDLAIVTAFNPNRGKSTTIRLLGRVNDPSYDACMGG